MGKFLLRASRRCRVKSHSFDSISQDVVLQFCYLFHDRGQSVATINMHITALKDPCGMVSAYLWMQDRWIYCSAVSSCSALLGDLASSGPCTRSSLCCLLPCYQQALLHCYCFGVLSSWWPWLLVSGLLSYLPSCVCLFGLLFLWEIIRSPLCQTLPSWRRMNATATVSSLLSSLPSLKGIPLTPSARWWPYAAICSPWHVAPLLHCSCGQIPFACALGLTLPGCSATQLKLQTQGSVHEATKYGVVPLLYTSSTLTPWMTHAGPGSGAPPLHMYTVTWMSIFGMSLVWLCRPFPRDDGCYSVPTPPLPVPLLRRQFLFSVLASWTFMDNLPSSQVSPGGPFFNQGHIESSIGIHQVAAKIGTLKHEQSIFGGAEWMPMLGSPPWLCSPPPFSLTPPGYM